MISNDNEKSVGDCDTWDDDGWAPACRENKLLIVVGCNVNEYEQLQRYACLLIVIVV